MLKSPERLQLCGWEILGRLSLGEIAQLRPESSSEASSTNAEETSSHLQSESKGGTVNGEGGGRERAGGQCK